MTNNVGVINKAAITTDVIAGGLLSAGQAKKFIEMTFEDAPLCGLVRREQRTANTGSIDKIGIGSRLLRKKTENEDDEYRALAAHGSVAYAATAVRLPWEITEETLRQNIAGEEYESVVTEMMTRQVGTDQEDICLNGDTAVSSSDPDYDFLKLNDGWIKQLLNGGHVADMSGGGMSLDVFYDALRTLPKKYNNGRLRWLMSPGRRQEWERYMINQAVMAGGAVTDKWIESPVSVPVVEVPAMPDDKIILTDPQNLIVVNTYDVKIRKTTEGKEAIMQDKRFYVIHFDFDPVIEELDAAVIVKGLD